ncbi:MAG: hypothetical protein GXY32_11660 [Ruminococcaceae bacterium]|nr:hypothetical protein [Oscillospiraceae bacterium]
MVGGINSLLSSYYTQANSQVNSTSQIYDYKAAQQQTKQWVEEYKANNTQVQALKKDSADFLQQYTGSMNTLATAANKLAGGGVDKLLTGRDGQVTDETIKATVDAAQKMVDAHNSSVKLLNDNADRGAGVVNQLARMVGDPAASAGMAMVGMKMNDDGTLALDIEKMTAALKSETPGDTDLFADIIGEVADSVQKDARAGLNTSAGSLIGNDVAKMQSIRDNDPIRSFAQSMRGGGAYAFNNQAAVGILMNLTA